MDRRTIDRREVWLPAGGATLDAALALPPGAAGLVVFAHGGASGRFSPPSELVAARLEEAGLATLLLDLLTEAEEELDARTGHLRFDVDLLAARVGAALTWAASQPATRALPVGLFGASTGAAAALIAAADHPGRVRAVVSRGGRPDLAAEALRRVRAPTLLLVGARDQAAQDLHRAAARELVLAEAKLLVVPGAALLDEPGALEEVARAARGWFREHLR
ncbi:MAG: dienelactone hydrolase family protein [Planctomycetes bacterium]|nr:dienelactone hydrolase family protein [Planctomycetota bacterium]